MSLKQSDTEEPQQRMVSVAVLPPRLPPGMAPPTGVGAAGVFSWDESINWQHNEVASTKEPSSAKKFMRRAGLTAQRERRDPEIPPFIIRQLPYDVWRKHYAKDKDGNYKGTHAPAQDCLLLPADVQKWRFDETPKTQGDKWTRGTEVLPVYAEIEGQGRVPEYGLEYTGGVPPEEPTVDKRTAHAPSLSATQPPTDMRTGSIIADGKTAQQIIDEAKAKAAAQPKTSWRSMFKKGAEMAAMGT